MQQNDDCFPLQSTSTATASSQSTYTPGKSRTSLIRLQNNKLRVINDRNDASPKFRRDLPAYCASKTDIHLCSTSRERSQDSSRPPKKSAHPSQEKVFPIPDFVVSDCWKTTSGEIPSKLIQLFNENCLNAEDADALIRKRRLDSEEDVDMLSSTKEFHVLNEVQKARVLTVIEETIRKLANRDLKDYNQGCLEPPPKTDLSASDHLAKEKFLCRKFMLPWVILKIVEMILCHIIQLTFLSQESYFQRKKEFLPVVVTYYLTLFIIILSLAAHISCFSCSGIRNPCYFMSAVSCSILTLTTTLGILVMLTMMEFYKSFREILVLVFIAALLSSLFVELCLCYMEVKHFWTTAAQTELYCAD